MKGHVKIDVAELIGAFRFGSFHVYVLYFITSSYLETSAHYIRLLGYRTIRKCPLKNGTGHTSATILVQITDADQSLLRSYHV